jgi:uncharacterized membrane protein YoaK (UPF0700 family)
MDSGTRERLEVSLILIAIAGYVDANGFIALGHLFVSFMSGNSTQFAVRAVQGDWGEAVLAGTIVALFLGGVVAGRLLATVCKTFGRPVVLIVEAAVLAVGIGGFGSKLLSSTPLVLAMGIQNAAVRKSGEPKISVTYVTGTLVHLGEKFVDGILDSSLRWSWLPYLSLWLAMVFGAAVGAVFNILLGREALILPVAALLILAALTAFAAPET